MSARLTLKIIAIVLMAAGAVMAGQFTGTTKIVGMAVGTVGIAAFIVLTVFTGGGDPKKKVGDNPPPLRYGNMNHPFP